MTKVIYEGAILSLCFQKKRGDLRYVKVAVKDLTMDELQNLKVSHTTVLETEANPERKRAASYRLSCRISALV